MAPIVGRRILCAWRSGDLREMALLASKGSHRLVKRLQDVQVEVIVGGGQGGGDDGDVCVCTLGHVQA
jgi:hypothetical protein